MFGIFLSKERYDELNNSCVSFENNGIPIEYLDIGNKDGEPILFVHGLAANVTYFYPNISHFEDKYRIICVSLRGHGQSGHPEKRSIETYSLASMGDDLKALLDHLGVKKVHFVGNSMGGMVGLDLIGRHEEYFLSLTTFGTPGKLRIPKFLVIAFGLMLPGIAKVLGREKLSSLVVKLIAKAPKCEEYLKTMFAISNIKATYYCRINSTNYSYLHVVKKIGVPYMILVGKLDKFMNSRMYSTVEASRMNPNIILEVMKLSGHCANLDFPKEFNLLLEDFLKGW